MTYNNYDDSRVQIPREMFEARQRQLAAVGGGGGSGGGGGVGDTTRRQLSHKIRSRSHRGGDTGGGQQEVEVEETPPSTTEQDTGTINSLQPGDLGWAEYAGLGSIPLQPHLRSVEI